MLRWRWCGAHKPRYDLNRKVAAARATYFLADPHLQLRAIDGAWVEGKVTCPVVPALPGQCGTIPKTHHCVFARGVGEEGMGSAYRGHGGTFGTVFVSSVEMGEPHPCPDTRCEAAQE